MGQIRLAINLCSGSITRRVRSNWRADSPRQAGGNDLAIDNDTEIKILLAYMPQQLTEAEVAALIEQGKAETGAAGGKDMGKLMAWLKPRVAGKTDMGKLSGLVKSKLG